VASRIVLRTPLPLHFTLEVKSNHNGIACELCGMWYHAKCIGISSETYSFFFKSCRMSDGRADSGTQPNGGVVWFCVDNMGSAAKIIKNISAVKRK